MAAFYSVHTLDRIAKTDFAESPYCEGRDLAGVYHFLEYLRMREYLGEITVVPPLGTPFFPDNLFDGAGLDADELFALDGDEES